MTPWQPGKVQINNEYGYSATLESVTDFVIVRYQQSIKYMNKTHIIPGPEGSEHE